MSRTKRFDAGIGFMKHFRWFLLFLFLVYKLTVFSQNEIPEEDVAFDVGMSYTADVVTNFSGGIKKGSAFLGLIELDLGFDTEKAQLWKGGQFFLKASNTHGAEPSATLVGDIQVLSNIEAGNHTYFQEMWFKQTIRNFELTIGLQDLNVEITSMAFGEMFLNSSFGVLPIISLNLHAPIYPLTSLGITTKWKFHKKMAWLNAVYDGTPTDFEQNPYNLKWNFDVGDGLLMVSEFQNMVAFKGLSGVYKVGVFAHNHFVERTIVNDFPDSLNTNTAGAYLSYEQQILSRSTKEINAFIHGGYSPSEVSLNHIYIGAGMGFSGFFSKKNNETLGVSGGWAKLNHGMGHESMIELSWKKQIAGFFYLQPDFQYIIHPGGSQSGVKNAFVGILRFGLEI